jgi:glycosyltransferase involved in cell wall biosynthesis
MTEVSVVIPTYNREKLVTEAVSSVLAQGFRDFEIIVVDDGSTDGTRDAVESIGDPRIRYFYKDNGGCASARNWGLARTTGRFVAYLDSDDLWPPRFLEVMLGRLREAGEYGCAYCPIVVTYPDGRTRRPSHFDHCRSGRITRDLFAHSFIWIQAAVFRKEALQGLVFDESLRNGADTDAILRLATRTSFLFVPDIEVTFRAEHGVSARQDVSSLNCNRIRVLERFYYLLGGREFIPAAAARKKLSHAYRAVAKNYHGMHCRKAALYLYRKALAYRPWDARLYAGLLSAWFLSRGRDGMKEWKMPEKLGIGH